MKKLSDIIKNIDCQTTVPVNINFQGTICFDSRKVQQGDIFVAITGTQVDGHRFIETVLQKQPVAIVCEYIPENLPDNASFFVKTPDTRKALALMAANYYDHPSGDIRLVGITGTNGKTTTVTLLYQLFTSLGYMTGMLSTVENRIGEQILPATHTTTDPMTVNRLLAEMKKAGVTHCFMEVSSHAIDQHRVTGLSFDGVVFTNLTRDHLDYHDNMKNYLYAKKKLFDNQQREGWALTNLDDKNGHIIVQNAVCQIKTYGIRNPADYKGKIIESTLSGLHLEFNQLEFWSKLTGRFNAYNLLAAYATAFQLGEEPAEILTSLSDISGAEGRFERVQSVDGIFAIVDYAHTPDALEKILTAINELRTRNEQLITVVGAGGNRDNTKRPIMGKIAASLSDKIIFTSDNPRNENPDKILDQIIEGVDAGDKAKAIRISDREEAIKTACLMAQPGDIILIAGKGHEKYQEIQGQRLHFDDKEMLYKYLKIK
jgi:UDP-N-acetylmuramoyl-L-alanyl-D-glutamate--2,6-diaminopimelate ligase